MAHKRLFALGASAAGAIVTTAAVVTDRTFVSSLLTLLSSSSLRCDEDGRSLSVLSALAQSSNSSSSSTASASSSSSSSSKPPRSGESGAATGAKASEVLETEDVGGGHETLLNWSGTHFCRPRRIHTPSTHEELEALVKEAHKARRPLRPVGSALSPNGLPFNEKGELVNLANLDKVLSVDIEKKQIRVQAGARISDVVRALIPYGLTLQNYASICEQQVGGLIQAGAHGTGASIPPSDAQVTALTVVTPGKGTLHLSEKDADLFRLARLGLGSLGVVSDVTMQCVDAHELVEYTQVFSREQVFKDHEQRLKQWQHLRYMWIPYSDSVVVVASNPKSNNPPSSFSSAAAAAAAASSKNLAPSERSNDDALAPLRNIVTAKSSSSSSSTTSTADLQIAMESSSFGQLRDLALLAGNGPTNAAHVKQVNQAEAKFWQQREGVRQGPSDAILQFDCGGQQWVSEVCFPVDKSGRDLMFMKDLLDLIETNNLPAPSPLEQRWTSASSSPLSPAYSKPSSSSSSSTSSPIFSWVGIIMYLPPDTSSNTNNLIAADNNNNNNNNNNNSNNSLRNQVTNEFVKYRNLCEQRLWDKYGAIEHWAKVEIPATEAELEKKRQRIRNRCDVDAYLKARQLLDPYHILGNRLVDSLLK